MMNLLKNLKDSISIVMILFGFLLTACAQESNRDTSNFQGYSGKYFGQTPPGNTPVIFAPGIISLENYFEHSAAIFSPNYKEVYWSAKPNGARYFKIYFKKLINDNWSKTKIASFCQEADNYDNPVFSPDGNKLFYEFQGNIWFVNKMGDTWSAPINTNLSGKIHSVMSNGTIYFSKYNPSIKNEGESNVIYIVKKTNDKYSEPENIGRHINTDDAFELGAYISPNQKYMIIESTIDRKMVSLKISYKMLDGSWSKQIPLPFGWGRFPAISPDGNYLFFMKRDGIYWVNTSFIDKNINK